MTDANQERKHARALLDFIDASPSPWHATASAASVLTAAGFARLDEADPWRILPGGRYFVVRGGASLIAFVVGNDALPTAGLRLIGAHTDSPGLRLKPRPTQQGDNLGRLGVDVYGGPILASFADRDLGLAGRVIVRTPQGPATRLLSLDGPVARLPNLAIHMNRDVNEQGLKFNRQTELPLIFGNTTDAESALRALLASSLEVPEDTLLTWELAAFDTQPGAFWGASGEFIAHRQLDNLASCHAALAALQAASPGPATQVIALFDHEEVGSESATGASGSFMSDVLARIAHGVSADSEDLRRALARSLFLSADMAHAYHPNFPNAYEPGHKVAVNSGPVIKTNPNQRYATNAETAAHFMMLCERAGVPCQHYVHRGDLGCGSTIGPTLAARLGIASLDVGAPMWAMHSARESAGALDHGHMVTALREFLQT